MSQSMSNTRHQNNKDSNDNANNHSSDNANDNADDDELAPLQGNFDCKKVYDSSPLIQELFQDTLFRTGLVMQGSSHSLIRLTQPLPGYDCRTRVAVNIPPGFYAVSHVCYYNPLRLFSNFHRAPTDVSDPEQWYYDLCESPMFETLGDYKVIWQLQPTNTYSFE